MKEGSLKSRIIYSCKPFKSNSQMITLDDQAVVNFTKNRLEDEPKLYFSKGK